MRQFIQNNPFISSLLINLGLFLVFLGLFYTRYGTTDDVEMQMVLAGKCVLLEPSAYLRYTHIFIGEIISTLYTWMPSIPWYGCYLTLAHLLGMIAILYSILIFKSSLFRVAAFIACFALGETALLQELQYTSSSIVLEIGGVFLLFTAISKPEDSRKKKWLLFSFLMIAVGGMIRWQSLQLTVVLATPLLLYGIFQQTEKRLFNLLFCTTILLGSFGINQIHYGIVNQDKGWQEFNYFQNSIRSAHDILDYRKPQYKWTPSTADDYFYRVGWEYEDLMLFKHWFFADSSVYGLQQFQALQETFQDCPYPEEHIEQRIWYFFIEHPFKDYVHYGFLMIGLSLLLIRGNKWLYLLLGGSALLVFSVLGVLFVYRHLPIRVSYSMAFYLMCLSTLFITYDKEVIRKTKFFVLILIGFMAISNLKMVTNESSKAAFNKMYWSAALDSLYAKPEQLYIGGGDFYMQSTMTPYQSLSDSMFMDFNMLDFGHLSNSPTHYKQLENFDIKNIHIEAPLDSNIYLVHRYDSPLLKWYANFIFRHYGIHIKYELIRKEKEVNIAVYAIKEQIRDKENSQGISLSNMHEFGLKAKDPKKFEDDPTKPKADYLEEEAFLLPD
jgi:hypothetical protein